MAEQDALCRAAQAVVDAGSLTTALAPSDKTFATALRRLESVLRNEKARREQTNAAWECLDMVRETLEALGVDMKGCAPMFYNDAVRTLAQKYEKRLAALATSEPST